MRAEDVDEVVAIERASFGMPWSRGAFLYEIEQNRVARCWVLREAGRIIAYICLWEIGDELHVTNIAVLPAQRRRGLARSLLTAVIDDVRQRGLRVVSLEVRPSNREAVPLYESFGFKAVGRRKGYYYDTGEDAVIMELALDRLAAAHQPAGNRRHD
jgi:ribosomal-protein-alanine N-acetyltransferase